jgi:dihydrofolate reductase
VSANAEPRAAGRIRVVLVAAMGENGVIGRDGRLPWRLKSELQHFRALTWGKPVVMGRRTYLSIAGRYRPLAGRTNVVVSRNPDFTAPGAVVAPALELGLAIARADALRRSTDTIMVAGGADIYAQTMPLADEIALTLVHCRPPGDTLFPAIDAHLWQEISRVERPAEPDDSAAFAYVCYQRRPAAPGRVGGVDCNT